ncbi:phage tail protein [Aestuariivirga sp. YIM B02566]|uniref:Phage tail protein n=1 Tax=Taklimakanibacter albus TaxID=2800327 RepID=A0ACC5R6G1_9HYPH|nr:phage tail protein [Aestuariivirga sp. YIM B02566]MBK1868244.1 phage tail protein [Aestuariivirga sp. YIM B02566]
MNTVLLALGPFRFQVRGPSYEKLNLSTEARWEQQDRLSRAPAMQFIGPGVHTLTIDGTIYTHYSGGFSQIERMRSEMGKGRPHILVSGYGRVFGKYVIQNLDTTQTFFLADGAPLKVEFTTELKSYGEDGQNFGGLF